jgi:hypothetical protein
MQTEIPGYVGLIYSMAPQLGNNSLPIFAQIKVAMHSFSGVSFVSGIQLNSITGTLYSPSVGNALLSSSLSLGSPPVLPRAHESTALSLRASKTALKHFGNLQRGDDPGESWEDFCNRMRPAIGCAQTEVFLFPSVAMSIDSGCVLVVGRWSFLCVCSRRVSVYCLLFG